MDKKILLAIIAVIAVIVIGVGAFSLGVFGQTTEVDTKFLSGTIQGEAIENKTNVTLPGWEAHYNDTKNGIESSFGMIDTFNLTKDMLTHMLGLKKIDTKDYEGVKWDIYYLDADITNNKVKSMNTDDLNVTPFGNTSGYFCFASGKNGDYCVAVGSENVSSDNSLNSELFKNYVEPLLKSITLKDPQNPPKEYQYANMTKEEYDLLNKYVKDNGWDSLINLMG
jgi:hypothetical protein